MVGGWSLVLIVYGMFALIRLLGRREAREKKLIDAGFEDWVIEPGEVQERLLSGHRWLFSPLAWTASLVGSTALGLTMLLIAAVLMVWTLTYAYQHPLPVNGNPPAVQQKK